MTEISLRLEVLPSITNLLNLSIQVLNSSAALLCLTCLWLAPSQTSRPAIHRSLCCLVVPYGVDAVCKPMKTVFCQEQWNNLNQMSEPDQVYEKVHISDTGYWNQWCRTSLCNPAFCTILLSVLLGEFFYLQVLFQIWCFAQVELLHFLKYWKVQTGQQVVASLAT